VVIDAVRFCKLGLDRGIGGQLDGPSSYLMKTPPTQYTDDIARQLVDSFIAEGRERANGVESKVLSNGHQPVEVIA
jgi:myo-inositol-1-phosphate synthase